MPNTLAQLGKGVLLKRGNGASPEVFTTIEEMSAIPEAPSSLRDLVPAPHHDMVGFERPYILGLAEGNEIQGVANYVGGTQQNGLLTDKDAGTDRTFQLLFPQFSNKLCTFTALVRGWSISPPIDGITALSFTLKVTGTPVWT